MKKRNLILTAALFAMTASLAACGGQKPATTQPAAATAAETKGGDQKEEPKEDQKPEETAVSYTHLDVYKRQPQGPSTAFTSNSSCIYPMKFAYIP